MSVQNKPAVKEGDEKSARERAHAMIAIDGETKERT